MYLETTRFIYVYLIEFLQNLVCKTMILVLSPAMRRKLSRPNTQKPRPMRQLHYWVAHHKHFLHTISLYWQFGTHLPDERDIKSRPPGHKQEILDVAFEKSKSKFTTPRQTIQDTEELQSYQQTKRKEFEQHINKTD